MITFEPDSPWEVGQEVTLREDDRVSVMVVEKAELVRDTDEVTETQYKFVTPQLWELRRQGVRPFIELD